MAEVLSYIEIDVPFCTLTYGVLPCGARLPTADDPVPASFDGSTTYLNRGGGLTGASDSKSLTFSCWVKVGSVSTGQYLIVATSSLNGGTQRTCAGIIAGGAFFVAGYNAAGTLILDQRSSAIATERWVHVLASFDLSNASRKHIYIDDAADIASGSTFTNDTMDFTMSDWGIGALPDASFKLGAEIADLWLAPGVYLDLSVASNRRKFITADRNPVALGASGATPTGSSPLVFMSGDIASWQTNKGTGGGFTLTGTLREGEFATGEIKCFNTRRTCQDLPRFDEDEVTFRYAKSTDFLPKDIDCIPNLSSVDFTPSVVSLGVNLGQRATLSATFRDHPHSDTGEGYDKYLTDRDYDPWYQGTYWGKFRARQPYLRGRTMRWITGKVGDDLVDMETRTFIVESFSGPTPDGKFTISGKDVLKLADGDRSQAPVLSNGFLSADITASETAATLLPSGIGDVEYAASGWLCIGGNEVVSFTRSGDALTITRGQLGTSATTHKAQDRVQTVLRYDAEDAADILYDLLVTYADVPASYITLVDWQEETSTFLGSVYTANICEPTAVATLASELIEQAALSIWWNDVGRKIRLRVLRAITTDAAIFTPENTLKGTLQIREQPEKRLSRVQVYFGQKDPTKPLSNLDNYRSSSLSVDEDAERAYGSIALKTILSRWIPEAGRSVADRLGVVQLGRYRDPPRQVQLQLMRFAGTDVELGVGYRIESDCVQDATGAPSNIPIQVTRLNPGPDKSTVEGEEMLWFAPFADTGTRYVIFDASNFNINLRTSHDSIYPPAQAGDAVICIINAGVTIGSVAASLPSFDVGSWPAGVDITIILNGMIQGAGGSGGTGSTGSPGSNGAPGGTAFYTRQAIDLEIPPSANLWGGGGGGGGGGGLGAGFGGGGGGGGAGQNPGTGSNGGVGSVAQGTIGSPGSRNSGGSGGPGGGEGANGGNGGGPGLAGLPGGNSSLWNGGSGGAAGKSIDGVSFVTVTVSGGDVRGPQIN